MKTKLHIIIALIGLMAISLSTNAWAQTVEETYAGKIVFQDQTISKASAKALHRQIDLQRASQLVLWSLPVTSFYQLYGAIKSDLPMNENEPVIGLYEGYDGVYPYLTANVTTPYTISMVDLSKTGPLVVIMVWQTMHGRNPSKKSIPEKRKHFCSLVPGRTIPKILKVRSFNLTPLSCFISIGF